jgi:hypothetical protein
VETVGFRALADELNVSVAFLSELARRGVLETVGNRILKASADELRWQLAAHKSLLPEDDT